MVSVHKKHVNIFFNIFNSNNLFTYFQAIIIGNRKILKKRISSTMSQCYSSSGRRLHQQKCVDQRKVVLAEGYTNRYVLTFHRCFLPSFGSFGQTVSEVKNLKNQPIRNKNRLWQPCLLTDRDGMSNLYRGPSIDASYQVSDHLDKRFQRRRFLEIDPIRNKNCLWRPCLSMDLDEMSTLYRGPPIDASYQVSVHLAKRFQRRRFLKISNICIEITAF